MLLNVVERLLKATLWGKEAEILTTAGTGEHSLAGAVFGRGIYLTAENAGDAVGDAMIWRFGNEKIYRSLTGPRKFIWLKLVEPGLTIVERLWV